MSEDWVRLCNVHELSEERPLPASIRGRDLVAVLSAGEPRVFDGRCPHQGTLLAEGEITNGQLICRAHGWQFDANTGACTSPLRSQCLVRFAAEVRGADLWVRIPTEETRVAVRLRSVHELRGPRGLPVVGNLLDLRPTSIHRTIEDWARTHGPLCRYRFGRRDVLIVSDIDDIEAVLRARPGTFRRLAQMDEILAELGVRGVFSAEGDTWRAQRRLAMEALSSRHLKGFFPTLRRVMARFRNRLLRLVGEPIDLQQELMRFTVDVTTSLAFSVDMNTIENDTDPIQNHLHKLFPAVTRRLASPIPYWRYIKRKEDRELDASLSALQTIVRGFIAETRQRLAREAGASPRNFLEAMALAKDAGGQPFSDDTLYGNALTMLLAGEDTTANTISWAVHELLDHPDYVARVHAEAEQAVDDEFLPSMESVASLRSIGALIDETMRVRPVAPILFLEALESTAIADIKLDPGLFVVAAPSIPATDARYFARPDAFLPERWLGEVEGPHTPRASLPFGSGPRLCPGRSLALLEMRLVLSLLYGTFTISREGSRKDVRDTFAFTVCPEGLRVRLGVRSRPS